MSVVTTTQPLPHIYEERCTGCGQCAQRCPTRAVEVLGGRAIITQPDACTFCDVCETYCPTGTIGRPFVIRFVTPSPERPC